MESVQYTNHKNTLSLILQCSKVATRKSVACSTHLATQQGTRLASSAKSTVFNKSQIHGSILVILVSICSDNCWYFCRHPHGSYEMNHNPVASFHCCKRKKSGDKFLVCFSSSCDLLTRDVSQLYFLFYFPTCSSHFYFPLQ